MILYPHKPKVTGENFSFPHKFVIYLVLTNILFNYIPMSISNLIDLFLEINSKVISY